MSDTAGCGRLVEIASALVRRAQSPSPETGVGRRLLGGLISIFLLAPLFLVLLLTEAVGMRHRLVVTTRRGLRQVCHPPDLVEIYIALFGLWEPDTTKTIEDHLEQGDLVLDLGAYSGYHALLAADCVGDHGRVIAVEPVAEHVARLEANRALNHFEKRIEIRPLALGASGEVDLFAGPSYNLGRTTTSRLGFPKVGTVEARPLEQIVEPQELQSASLIKIDIEGAEGQALESLGAVASQLNPRVVILIELSPRWWRESEPKPEQLLAPFRESGFEVRTFSNSYWPFRYFWPLDCPAPGLLNHPIPKDIRRIDLVLQRPTARVAS